MLRERETRCFRQLDFAVAQGEPSCGSTELSIELPCSHRNRTGYSNLEGSKPWLGDRESNPDMLVQSQLSYH
jgi:hypothetical protein